MKLFIYGFKVCAFLAVIWAIAFVVAKMMVLLSFLPMWCFLIMFAVVVISAAKVLCK